MLRGASVARIAPIDGGGDVTSQRWLDAPAGHLPLGATRLSMTPHNSWLPEDGSSAALGLLGGFSLLVGRELVSVPTGARRMLAMLAVSGQPMTRSYLAGSLWPEACEPRAYANLRAALWRLRQLPSDVVVDVHGNLALHDEVHTDLGAFVDWSERLISGRGRLCDLAVRPSAFGWELLPGWYDDWLEIERERTRQLWLHAVEALAHELIRLGHCARAVDAGLAAVRADPLRETAHRMVILAHLGEDNVVEARRQFDRCRQLLGAELGIAPSPELAALVTSRRC